ncbi:MAG: Rho-binding antiterminator [Gammaproteobacteria bacterium]|nr:Rho-binding antiterminator [Gammaproteobacteria bacterium]
MTDYVPIDCDRHSVLEVLALRRSRVTLDARADGGGVTTLGGIVSDVVTRDGAEFLVVEGADGMQSLRLDRLLEIRAGAAVVFSCQNPDERS